MVLRSEDAGGAVSDLAPLTSPGPSRGVRLLLLRLLAGPEAEAADVSLWPIKPGGSQIGGAMSVEIMILWGSRSGGWSCDG